MTTTITNITTEQKNTFKIAQQIYLVTKAKYETVKELERKAGNNVLKRHEFYYIDKKTGKRSRLLDDREAYLLNDEDFIKYIKLKHKERLSLGITPEPEKNIEGWNISIEGQMFQKLKKAEDALMDAGFAIIPNEEVRQQLKKGRYLLHIREKLLDLMVRLDIDK